ncbi:MAG: hypothetical protein HZB56_03855 [Deltaproteobacteria bacterium]|nr:hypothetical protein [Deltaproteobacteria bacterium]
MRIAASSVELRAERQAERTFTHEERVRAWVDPAVPERGAPDPAPVPAPDPGGSAPPPPAGTPLSRHDVDLLILTRAFRLDLRLAGAAEIARGYADGQARAAGTQAAGTQGADAPDAPERAGWGLEVDVREREVEREAVAFSARGKVQTADGRRLDVAMALSMERVRIQERAVSLRAGDAQRTDPIALALQGSAVEVSGTHPLDLDGDGSAEQVARLAPGSAWLARDLDGDGRVTGGGELFGPSTGDGYAEVRALDADGSGWVDEADPAFASLRLWSPAEGARLSTLAERGVGALYTGAAATPFTLATPQGAPGAEVAETGLFLREDGTAGALQHVDLLA